LIGELGLRTLRPDSLCILSSFCREKAKVRLDNFSRFWFLHRTHGKADGRKVRDNNTNKPFCTDVVARQSLGYKWGKRARVWRRHHTLCERVLKHASVDASLPSRLQFTTNCLASLVAWSTNGVSAAADQPRGGGGIEVAHSAEARWQEGGDGTKKNAFSTRGRHVCLVIPSHTLVAHETSSTLAAVSHIAGRWGVWGIADCCNFSWYRES